MRELARQLELSAPATHNPLKTLAAARLGAGADPGQHMRRFARPYIQLLAAKSDETFVVLAWQHGS